MPWNQPVVPSGLLLFRRPQPFGTNVVIRSNPSTRVQTVAGVAVGATVTVAVGVAVAVAVGVAEGVGAPPLQKSWTLSTLQPVFERLMSLAIRQRKTVVCPLAEAGRFTVVVMKPPDVPLHAIRPAMGLL